jgi:tetratricopeptide (TPR) repeat protein
MKLRFAIGTLTVATALILGHALPAGAQYANQFTPAKLITQGKTTHTIAGSGTTVVQVQVNADGSHKAIKVINSTNPANNAAAMDIAQNSTYRPAHRGSTPVTSFYDFRLRFNGRSVANAATEEQSTGDGSGGGTSVANQNQAASLAVQAVKMADDNPTQALALAQKAMSLDPDTNSKYALGRAQLANKQYSDAIATLKEVHTAAFADPKMPTNAKVAIDTSLMTAYFESNDTQNAQAMAAEIKQLDPTSTLPGQVLGNSLINAGVSAGEAKNYDEAFKDFDQAAAQGDPQVAVTAYTQAALLVSKMEKPDYKRMQAYAEKALALKPDDPMANFAEGIAFTGQWASSHDDATKKKALDSLTKADQQAKAAGNIALSLQIETFIKQNLNSAPASQSGSS